MHYSDRPTDVRVDFFRADELGRPAKWYATESVPFEIYNGMLLEDAFETALRRHLARGDGTGRLRYGGMVAFCGEPCHEHAHPIVMRVPVGRS